MDMSRYLDLFVSEARQHLQEAEREISRLGPDAGAEGEEALNNLFRHFHSLKGMAASMGFEEIATLSHAVEDLLDEIRKDPARGARPGVGEVVLEAFDALSALVAEASSGARSFPSQEGLIGRVKRIFAETGLPAPPPGPPAEPPAPEGSQPSGSEAPAATAGPSAKTGAVFRCRLQIDPAADLPAARAALALRRLEAVGTILTSTPSRESLGRQPFDGTITLLLSTTVPRARLTACIEELIDVSSYSITEELLPSEATPGKGAALRETEAGLPSTIRIPTASLDHFLDTLGELITWRGSLGAALRIGDLDSAAEGHTRLSRAVDRLREEVMAIRLLPFEHIVPHLNQTVRTLSRQTGKRVSLQISGTEVALDRAVLEEILDPLNHLLRNAVDHGIELPVERTALGKDPTGRILLAVSRRGDRVGIRLEDDGRGMDSEIIARTAQQLGYITPAQAAGLAAEEILMLTTVPGFSMAQAPTELSGRGVGMDVVRTRLEKLGGRMSLESRPGQGLTVTLDLPLTVAVIDAFLVSSGGMIFAVPSSAATRTVHATAAALRRDRSATYLDVGGSLVPALRPDEALGLGSGARPFPDRFPVLMVEAAGIRSALAVEAILERRELVVKPLGSPLDHLREYSGAALLDDGRITLILDVVNLASSATGS